MGNRKREMGIRAAPAAALTLLLTLTVALSACREAAHAVIYPTCWATDNILVIQSEKNQPYYQAEIQYLDLTTNQFVNPTPTH